MARRRKNYYRLSRKNRNTVLVFVIVLLVLTAAVDYLKTERTGERPIAVGAADSNDFEKYDGREFLVIKVVDGDTLDINEPDRDKNWTRIRLWGVDTPETSKSPGGEMYYGPQASEFTRESTLNKLVVIRLDAGNNTRGKYGRLLAYVELPDGRVLNEVLLSEGYAYADLRFRHSMYDDYIERQTEAQENGAGLWGQVKREDLPRWLQRNRPKLLNTN
ncbi:MAG: thermonuclease family protein [Phycisphaerae bacterium]|jgi:micrococcal nuclease